jgi:hypothetical protein
VQPEGAIHQVPPPTKVRQYRLDPLVVTGDRVVARDVPVDIVGEHHSDRRLVTAGVEGLLRLVQPAQQVDGLGSLRDMAMVAVLAEELRDISGDRPGVGARRVATRRCPPQSAVSREGGTLSY